VPGLVWLGLGLAKLFVGLAHDRPVGFLMILLVVATIALAMVRPPRRTTRGEQLLRWVTGGAHSLEATSKTAPSAGMAPKTPSPKRMVSPSLPS
jgi:uncharacterized protein (TIGR04222 family)